MEKRGQALRVAGCTLLALALLGVGCKWIKTATKKSTPPSSPVASMFPPGVTVTIPRRMKNAENDSGILADHALVVGIDGQSRFYLNKSLVANEQLASELGRLIHDSDPPMPYLIADNEIRYGAVLEACNAFRRQGMRTVGLVVTTDDGDQASLARFKVILPPEPRDDDPSIKPSPLILVSNVDRAGQLKLNNEEMGNIRDASRLTTLLKQIFQDRTEKRVYRPGTTEIEATVTIRASRSQRYGEVVKLVDAMRAAGAQPIELQIDDLVD